jgi:hypothetical protein
VSHVDHPILLDEVTTVRLQRAGVTVEQALHPFVDVQAESLGVQLADRHDDRGIMDDREATVDPLGQPPLRRHAVTGVRPTHTVAHRTPALLRAHDPKPGGGGVDGLVRIPDRHIAMSSEFTDGHPACARGRRDGSTALLGGVPVSRPAISRLVASRLTSHSNGPGLVSSKSLTWKTSRRSGEAKRPKSPRCASPHNWTVSPERGPFARSRP